MWFKYDQAPIVLDRARTWNQAADCHSFSKPSGFWITDDSEHCWRSWCVSERFGRHLLTHKHKVDLDESRILRMSNGMELLDFTSQYEAKESVGKWLLRGIDWKRVAERHSGIIITPYVWTARCDDRTNWYYGWDCASGCIWDARAILDVTLVETVPLAPQEEADAS